MPPLVLPEKAIDAARAAYGRGNAVTLPGMLGMLPGIAATISLRAHFDAPDT